MKATTDTVLSARFSPPSGLPCSSYLIANLRMKVTRMWLAAAAGSGAESVSLPTCGRVRGGVVVRCRESCHLTRSHVAEGPESLSKIIQFCASWKTWAQIHSQDQYKFE